MKYLICSDIHGSTRAANLIVELNSKEMFDKIFILGDFNYNGARNSVPKDYFPKKVVETLNPLKDKIIACKGNCESDVDLMVYEFPIPKFNSYFDGINSFYLMHGDDLNLLKTNPYKNEIVLFGHTHIEVYESSLNGGVILNPGSMTFPKGKLNKSFIIWNNGDIKLYEFEYFENEVKIIGVHDEINEFLLEKH